MLRRLIIKNNWLKVNSLLLNKCKCSYSQKSPADDGKNSSEKPQDDSKLGEIGFKYKTFKDEDAEVILDVYEERLKYNEELLEEEETKEDVFAGINLEHGLTGVFDIDDLVQLLNRESAQDVFVAQVPEDIQYVSYIVVVHGKSKRHMQAIIEFVRRVFKKKKYKNEMFPRIEGENSNEWMAIDLGNIALHVFSKDARAYYDLESLWAVGPEYDKEFNKKDEVVEMLEKHTIYLHDLEPAHQ